MYNNSLVCFLALWDIIIVGSQSGTLPLMTDNLGQVPLYTLEFLTGISPDAVILCVNPFVSINYISRAIKVIEGLTGNTKVIVLCLFPFDM